MDSKPITTAECVKDLGVLVAQDLSWDSHYKLISGKAYKMLGLIRRHFSVSCPISARRKSCEISAPILFPNLEALINQTQTFLKEYRGEQLNLFLMTFIQHISLAW